jgi:hypothetical protein
MHEQELKEIIDQMKLGDAVDQECAKRLEIVLDVRRELDSAAPPTVDFNPESAVLWKHLMELFSEKQKELQTLKYLSGITPLE